MQAEFAIPPWATAVVSDHTDMTRAPHPVDAAKVARFTLDLPDDVYYEYAFLDADGEMRPDPDNPRRADNPWYPEASALLGPDYGPPAPSPDDGAPEGVTDRYRVESGALGQTRRVVVYTPARLEGEPLPLVLLQDGTAYYRLARLPGVLDALLAEGRVRPARLAFFEPVDRNAEYAFSPPYRDFVADEALPFLEARHPGSGERALMGASLGGLFGATLALERPGLFRSVAAQSGAFLGGPDRRDFYRAEGSWVLDALEAREPDGLRVYTEVGTIEWLTDVNRRVRDALAARGYEHAYRERNAGHNWTNWRHGLAPALAFLLAPEGGGDAADATPPSR